MQHVPPFVRLGCIRHVRPLGPSGKGVCVFSLSAPAVFSQDGKPSV
ncbi:hypothetical protein HSB1_36390 [Halogranum salarium B-1]|uniref:Uncharacterized protein n=1 Tax=Halogranum salarium B-1 TaxID=1210908 RepID=J3EUU8_9EURY|nr:hypothetical protein HSB1_36390 [Halogranum salarium B-1]